MTRGGEKQDEKRERVRGKAGEVVRSSEIKRVAFGYRQTGQETRTGQVRTREGLPNSRSQYTRILQPFEAPFCPNESKRKREGERTRARIKRKKGRGDKGERGRGRESRLVEWEVTKRRIEGLHRRERALVSHPIKLPAHPSSDGPPSWNKMQYRSAAGTDCKMRVGGPAEPKEGKKERKREREREREREKRRFGGFGKG